MAHLLDVSAHMLLLPDPCLSFLISTNAVGVYLSTSIITNAYLESLGLLIVSY